MVRQGTHREETVRPPHLLYQPLSRNNVQDINPPLRVRRRPGNTVVRNCLSGHYLVSMFMIGIMS
jgi:hypothetical protein